VRQQDIIWLAGLLEGEGCFNYRADRKQARVTIEMTDRDIIERVSRLFDTNVSTRAPRSTTPCTCGTKNCIFNRGPKSKESYQTALHGTRAENLMRLVYPFMGKRRSEKIEEILGSVV
jgi:hypothetical protein